MMRVLKICYLFLCIVMVSCTKEFKRTIYVTTDSLYNKDASYMVSGTIVDAGEGFMQYGHCWATSKNPTLNNYHTNYIQPGNTEHFESRLDSLFYDSIYYIRSYVKENSNIVYGNEVVFDFKAPGRINNIWLIDTDTALIQLSLDTSRYATIEEYGYCWSGSNNLPTKDEDNSYTFENSYYQKSQLSYLTGLLSNQKYYIRAYAKINSVILYSATKTFTTGTLLYYNSLNNKTEIENNGLFFLEQISYKISNWDQAQVLPAVMGNGLFINHDLQEGWKNDGANFFAFDAQRINLSPEKGTLEFYFLFKCNADTSNYAYFFDMADSLKNHYESEVIKQGIYFSAGWNGWERLGGEKHFFFTIGNTFTNEMITIKTNTTNATLNEIINFQDNDILHFSFLWDVNGIYGTDETMNIYINNYKAAYTKETWQTGDNVNNYLFLGATPGFGYRDQNFNAVKGITDEFKIYNFVKYKEKIPEE